MMGTMDVMPLSTSEVKVTAKPTRRRYSAEYKVRILWEAEACSRPGEIAAHRDPPGIGEAEDHYSQALALAEELGMRPLIAQCHLGLGRLYRRIDNLEQAKRHLTTATSMMQEMQMGFWLKQAEAELKNLG